MVKYAILTGLLLITLSIFLGKYLQADETTISVTGIIVGLKEYDPPIATHGELWLNKITILPDGSDEVIRVYETPDSIITFPVKKGMRVTAIYEPFRTNRRGCLEELKQW